MAKKLKEYRVKNMVVETLAIALFEQKAEYGCSWFEVSESTRNKYRQIAQGESVMTSRMEKYDDTADTKAPHSEAPEKDGGGRL